MTFVFLGGAGVCFALFIALLRFAGKQPQGGMGLAGPFLLTLGGIPVCLALALISWLIGV